MSFSKHKNISYMRISEEEEGGGAFWKIDDKSRHLLLKDFFF
jgi:hypothetical protein